MGPITKTLLSHVVTASRLKQGGWVFWKKIQTHLPERGRREGERLQELN